MFAGGHGRHKAGHGEITQPGMRMDVFEVHERLVADYASFTNSLVQVRDDRIARHLEEERAAHVRWPDPWLSLNPSFEGRRDRHRLDRRGRPSSRHGAALPPQDGTGDAGGHPLTLYRHQREAIAHSEGSYVVTTGTGSGKSLTYIIPIVDSVMRDPGLGRIKAIVVYPMNALANSQRLELEKYLPGGFRRAPDRYVSTSTPARNLRPSGSGFWREHRTSCSPTT